MTREEFSLEAGLRALAQSTAKAEAPDRVEAALLKSFRERRRRARWSLGIGAAAAILVLLIALTRAPEAPVVRAPVPPAPETLVRKEPSPAPQVRQAVQRRPRKSQPPKPPPVAELATRFFPLPYGAPVAPVDSGQVVRVRLPRSALTSLGLPMNQERAAERVNADVLLGEDGLVRAIRFVR